MDSDENSKVESEDEEDTATSGDKKDSDDDDEEDDEEEENTSGDSEDSEEDSEGSTIDSGHPSSITTTDQTPAKPSPRPPSRKENSKREIVDPYAIGWTEGLVTEDSLKPCGVPCNICGRMFGSASIGLHVPYCTKKQEEELKRAAEDRRARNRRIREMPGVLCYICNRRFGHAGLPFHQKYCIEKWRRENDALPKKQRQPEPCKPPEQLKPIPRRSKKGKPKRRQEVPLTGAS